MISAMIQATNKDKNSIVALNGQILSGDEAREQAESIFDEVDNIKYGDKEEIQKIRSNQFFCNLYHSQKDDLGRIRTALIIWDKDTPAELIQSTIKALGLDFGKWKKLFADYQQRRKKQTLMLSLAVFVVIGIALALIIINSN